MSIEKPNVKLKTIQIIANKSNNKIFDHMTTISKNIYNSCVFSFNIFKLFKKQIYDDFFMNIKNIMDCKTNELCSLVSSSVNTECKTSRQSLDVSVPTNVGRITNEQCSSVLTSTKV